MSNLESIRTLRQRLKSSNYDLKDKNYFKFLIELEKQKLSPTEVIFQIGLYIGQTNLSRYLNFYELYKKTINLRGNCCEIGTWKGSSFLFIAKLIKIFEPHSKTKIYGFDWFKGQSPQNNDNLKTKGMYKSDYKDLKNNIKKLDLEDVAILVKLDITKQLEKFIKKKPWLEFKYAFLDCGSSDVLHSSMKIIWPRISKGGILVLDHYGSESTPAEKEIVKKYIGNNKVLQLSFSSHPAAYIHKK